MFCQSAIILTFDKIKSIINDMKGSRLYMPLFILRRFAFVMIIVPESLSTIVKIIFMIKVQVLYTISVFGKYISFEIINYIL